jgi:hypothetical protein
MKIAQCVYIYEVTLLIAGAFNANCINSLILDHVPLSRPNHREPEPHYFRQHFRLTIQSPASSIDHPLGQQSTKRDSHA